jgi:hypothetical protein
MSNIYYQQTPVEEYEFIVTLAIFTHGLTTTLDIAPNVVSMIDNTRIYMISPKFGSAYAKWAIDPHERGVYNHLKNIYQKTHHSNVIFNNLMDEYAEVSRPGYEKLRPYKSAELEGPLGTVYDPITFDKVYTIHENSCVEKIISSISNCLYGCGGIKIVSIHKRKNTKDTNIELIYPLKHHYNKSVDLTKSTDIIELTSYMFNDGHVIEDSGLDVLSTGGQEMTPKSDDFREKYSEFVSQGNQYNPYRNENEIEFIRLSQLIWIMKNLFGTNTNLNVFDYSCSNLYSKISEKEKSHFSGYVRGTDPELSPRPSTPTPRTMSPIQDIAGLRARSPRPLTPITGMLRGGRTKRRKRPRKYVKTRTSRKTKRMRSQNYKKNKKNRRTYKRGN